MSVADRPQDDPRYDTDFAAAWSIAVLAAVAGEGLDAICIFDAVGPRGVAHADGTVKPSGTIARTSCRPRRRADARRDDRPTLTASPCSTWARARGGRCSSPTFAR